MLEMDLRRVIIITIDCSQIMGSYNASVTVVRYEDEVSNKIMSRANNARVV